MHPVLFETGAVKIHSYGTMVLVALLLGVLAGVLVSGRFRAPIEKVVVTYGFAGGAFMVGAMFGNAILRGAHFDVHHVGFVLVSGIAAGALAAIATAFLIRGPVRPILDAFGIASLVGLGVGRIGCFLAGCCAGTPTSLPWGVHFPETATAIPADLRGEALHPTQLYLAAALVFAAAVLFARGAHLPAGRPASLALAAIAASSLATIPLRADPASPAPIVLWVLLLVAAIAGAILSASPAGDLEHHSR